MNGAGGRKTNKKKARSKRAPFAKNRKGMRHPLSIQWVSSLLPAPPALLHPPAIVSAFSMVTCLDLREFDLFDVRDLGRRPHIVRFLSPAHNEVAGRRRSGKLTVDS